MHGFYWDWSHGPFWGGGIFMVVFWICIIFFIVSFIRSTFKGDRQPESALDILKKRYAAGEVTREEFEQMKTEIHCP